MTTRGSVEITPLLKKLDKLQAVVREEGKVLVLQASEMGAEVARNKLESEISFWGAERMAGRRWGGDKKNSGTGRGPGRNDSGRMIDNLKAVPDNSAIRQRATFGWRQALISAFPYIKYQEEGFNNIISGRWQQGVFAIKDAQKYVREQLPRLEKNMKQRIRGRMK